MPEGVVLVHSGVGNLNAREPLFMQALSSALAGSKV